MYRTYYEYTTMTDIKVILESENIGIDSLNKEERDLIFDRILSENAGLGRAIVDSHADLMTSVIAYESRNDKPTLIELLLRKVIIISRDLNYNRIIPLIANDTEGIKVRFDTHILSARPGGEYVTPPGEEINVVGIVINDFCHQVLTLTNEGVHPTETPFTGGECKINIIEEIILRCNIHDRAIMFTSLGDSGTMLLLGAIFDCITADIPEEYFNERTSIESLATKAVPPPRTPEVQVNPLPMPALLESLGGSFINTGVLVLLTAIYSRGGQIYERAMIAGEKDPLVLAAIAQVHARDARIEFARSSKIAAAAARDRENEYRRIVAKKFGQKRLNKPGPILDSLTELERKSVLLELKRNEEYLTALSNNNCPHVGILRKLRRAKDIVSIRREFAALKKFFTRTGGGNSTKRSAMITCNNCKFDLICPHVVEKIECEINDCSYSEMKKRMSGFILAGNTTRDQQFCSICAEIISVSLDDDSAHSPDMDEELKTFIWGEVAGLIKYLKFGALIDVPKLITHCRDRIYQYIFDIEKQILKSKTNSAEEIKAKKRLYVTMYAMGYFINLIISGNNSAEISFKGFVQKSKNIIADMIRHAIEVTLTTRNIAIKSTGITQDVIKNTMVEVFKTIHSAGQQIITHTGASESLASILVLDPVYGYFRRQYNIGQLMNGKKVSNDGLGNIEAILGSSLSQLEKSEKNIYADAVIPHQISRPTTAAGKYVAKSYLLFRDRIISRSYLKPVYTLNGDDITINPVLAEEAEKYLPLAKMEDEYLTDLKAKYTHLYTWLRVVSDRSWKDRHGSLGRIYDEDGIRHNFDIFIAGPDSSPREFTANSIAKIIESGNKFTEEIVDKKCKVCGILWSNVDTLNEDKILESLAEKSGINGLFQFYDQRCPVGGMHEWKDKKCDKCGFDGKINRNYYQKYHSTYLQDRREGGTWKTPVREISKPEPVEFSFNFNIILDLADKLKVPQRLIMAIGATEKIEYTEIQSGAYIPRELDDRFDTRIYMIDGHIKNFIMEYNQLKHFNKLLKPPVDLSVLIDDSKFSRHKLADLATMMPDVSGDYREKFAYIQMHKKPREIKDFCIQSLCEIILAVYNDPTEETKTLRHLFCSYAIKKILRNEELLSKPGYFSWSLLYGDKEETTTDSNTQERTGDDHDDHSDDDNAMKNHFDVDGDSEDEPEIHVGDEYGL